MGTHEEILPGLPNTGKAMKRVVTLEVYNSRAGVSFDPCMDLPKKPPHIHVLIEP